MENSYPTGSIKQSVWEHFEKLLNEQGRFSVFRVEKTFKIVKRLCSLNRQYRVNGFSKLWITVQLRLVVVAVALNSLLQVSVARFTQLRKHSIQCTVLWSAVLGLTTESSMLPAADQEVFVFRV